MKTLIKIICAAIVLLACSSCFTTLAVTAVALSNIVPGERVTISGYTVQSVEPHGQAALLKTDGGDVVCIVYGFGKYRDGKRIKDKFIRGGVYQYTDADGSELFAPIFLRVKDYKQLWPVAVKLDVNADSSGSADSPQIYT